LRGPATIKRKKREEKISRMRGVASNNRLEVKADIKM
jgi:hypothetical protein